MGRIPNNGVGSVKKVTAATRRQAEQPNQEDIGGEGTHGKGPCHCSIHRSNWDDDGMACGGLDGEDEEHDSGASQSGISV